MSTTSNPDFTLPNLDALDADELRQLEQVFALATSYAGYTADARRYRLQGDIEAARAAERCAESAYRRLPTWARW